MSQDKSQFDGVSPDGTVALDANLPPDPSRRLWVATTCAVGGVAGLATAVPFVGSFAPSEKARAAGAPVQVDLTSIPEGQMRTVEWRGKPVWVLHRTEQQIEELRNNDAFLADPESERPGFTPPYAQNEHRSRDPKYLVAVGICTHLGCSPTPHLAAGPGPGLPSGWEGGFFCPCHGSAFDLAGRVYKNVPAPDNLEVPPYEFSADGTSVVIGVDENNKA